MTDTTTEWTPERRKEREDMRARDCAPPPSPKETTTND